MCSPAWKISVSSVEAAIDRIGLDTHRLSKRAKDLGSAAVLLALIMLAVVWGWLPRRYSCAS